MVTTKIVFTKHTASFFGLACPQINKSNTGQFKGYCHTCFRGLFPGEPVRKTRSSCLTDGCDMLTPGRAWGKLCIACYKKTGRKLPDNYFCTTAGCNKAKEKRGYCVQHFREAHPGEQPWTTCSNGGCQKNGQGKKFDGMCRACFKETYDDEKKCRDGG